MQGKARACSSPNSRIAPQETAQARRHAATTQRRQKASSPPARRASCPTHGALLTGPQRARHGSAPLGCHPRWQQLPAVKQRRVGWWVGASKMRQDRQAAGMPWAQGRASPSMARQQQAGQGTRRAASISPSAAAQERTRSLRTRHVVAVQPLVRSSSGALAAGQAHGQHPHRTHEWRPQPSRSAWREHRGEPRLPWHACRRLGPQPDLTVHPGQQVFIGMLEGVGEHRRERHRAGQAWGFDGGARY